MQQEVGIQTKDGLELAANLFEPQHSSKGVILLGPGLGVPKGYYFRYATFLAEQGYTVLLFDYRGIGEKHLKSPDQEKIKLSNWAKQDLVAVIDWLSEKYTDQKIFAILHSIGGQILGLVKNHPKLERVVFISAMGGYWRDEVFPVNIYSLFLWYVQIPLMTWMFGHLPKSFTYRGVPIAKGVAREWATWSKNSQYLAGLLGTQIPQHYYAEIQFPIDALWFTDDILATPRTLACILDLYTGTQLKKWPLNPREFGIKKIAHSGFFHPRCKEKLWHLPLEILQGAHDTSQNPAN